MSAASLTIAGRSNQVGAGTGIENAVLGSIQPVLIDLVKTLFPTKTWAWLTRLLCIEERVAKHRLAGTRAFTADELARLIRSEHGFKVVAAIMVGARASWWTICAPLMEVAEIQKAQLAARRRLSKVIQGAVHADVDLSAAIAKADAMLVQDEDFMRPHADAVRSVARAPHRSVAASKKGRGR